MRRARAMDWAAPVLIGAGFLLFAAAAWAQGAPGGGLSDALGTDWFKLLASSPWMALSVYLIWDGRKDKAARLEAYKEGAAAHHSTAEALLAVRDRLAELSAEVRAGHRT